MIEVINAMRIKRRVNADVEVSVAKSVKPKKVKPTSVRSALKWAGGKKKLVDDIKRHLPAQGCRRLIEPFVGGGSVFINMEFDEYLLFDMNKDLIQMFNIVKKRHKHFIAEAEKYFNQEHNTEQRYYELRDEFNNAQDPLLKSLIFLYMNRHGYNGLCRYNKSGGYNVPFGRYTKPYFPRQELEIFAQKSKNAKFVQGDFALAFAQAGAGDVIYCDPPYSPINRTANFTAYSGNSFGDDDQRRLVQCAQQAREKGISTLISNHYVDFTKELYKSADKINVFEVQRSISRNGDGRTKVDEVMALYC